MTWLKSMLVLAPLLATVGCHGSDPQQVAPDKFRPQQVNIQPSLRDEIDFSPVMTDYKSGNLHVEVPVRATTDLDINVTYHFIYFDDSHKPIEPATGTETTLLRSNQFEIISGTAPTSQARDFQLDIRIAK